MREGEEQLQILPVDDAPGTVSPIARRLPGRAILAVVGHHRIQVGQQLPFGNSVGARGSLSPGVWQTAEAHAPEALLAVGCFLRFGDEQAVPGTCATTAGE